MASNKQALEITNEWIKSSNYGTYGMDLYKLRGTYKWKQAQRRNKQVYVQFNRMRSNAEWGHQLLFYSDREARSCR